METEVKALPDELEVTFELIDWEKAVQDIMSVILLTRNYSSVCALAQTLDREIDEGRVFQVSSRSVEIWPSWEIWEKYEWSGKAEEMGMVVYEHDGIRIVDAFDTRRSEVTPPANLVGRKVHLKRITLDDQ